MLVIEKKLNELHILDGFVVEGWKRKPTSVQNILEDQLGRLVIEWRHTCEELEKTHTKRPPIHHEVCPGRRRQQQQQKKKE